MAKRKAVRERWAEIAQETQQIVLGDGQYVEERPLSAVPSSVTFPQVSSQGSDQFSTSLSVTRIGHDLFPQIQLGRQNTTFYPHYSERLAFWATSRRQSALTTSTSIEFSHVTTLSAARHLSTSGTPPPIGLLSSASPKRPGGGYLHGGDEQEEVLARHSSLVASLSSDAAKGFYKEHKFYKNEDGSGLHDHSMVYSPGIVVFRAEPDDTDVTDPAGGKFIPSYNVNVVSAVPVNAAAVRSKHTILPSEQQLFDDGMRGAMKERMARALRVFEEHGNRIIVLGAFGCGSSQNDVEVVASIWAELLVCAQADQEGASSNPARFKDVFDRVVFAVPGKLFQPFKSAFEMRVFEAEVAAAALSG